MSDSNVTSYHADYTNFPICNNNSAQIGHSLPGEFSSNSFTPEQVSWTTALFSVWDGDWAILEEYGQNNARLKSYLHGFHGLIKTFPDEFYYYQDSLGSTSHVTDDDGNLIEYYKYDLYGKPTYRNSSSQQLGYSTFGIIDLHGGQRWLPQLGLYDDRNRFMSPDLGRFLQPDPIGFKGDSSNLYRYCGNDWANRTDPMGLEAGPSMYTQAMRISTMDKVSVEAYGKDQEKITIKREVTGSHNPVTAATITATRGAFAATMASGQGWGTGNLSMGFAGLAALGAARAHDAALPVGINGLLAFDTDGGPRRNDGTWSAETSGHITESGQIVPPSRGGRTIDASRVPYVVAPESRAVANGGGLHIGDIGVVSANGFTRRLPIGDFGPGRTVEISTAAAPQFKVQVIPNAAHGPLPGIRGKTPDIPASAIFYPQTHDWR